MSSSNSHVIEIVTSSRKDIVRVQLVLGILTKSTKRKRNSPRAVFHMPSNIAFVFRGGKFEE